MGKKNPDWVWLPYSPVGGAGGGTFTEVLSNDGIARPDLVAREVLQNSWDAAQIHQEDDSPPFRFRFRFAELQGRDRKRFVEAARLDQLVAHRNEIGRSNRGIPSFEIIEEISDKSSPLRLLYLEDFGTHGMSGDPARFEESHLYKAMYILGSTQKDQERGPRGGAFGFGKSAFIGTSAIQSAITHTRFIQGPNDSTDQRLIGFTWWSDHRTKRQAFEGRAMYGIPADNARDGAVPLTGSDAANLASELGMVARTGELEDLGSSVLLISPLIAPEELNDAIERNWWPALEENLMDVVILTPDGDELVPRPRSNKTLVPYIRAYGIATGLNQPGNPDEERLASSKWRADRDGRKYGSLGLVLDKASPIRSASDDDEGLSLEAPTIALIRGPRMVIEYKTFPSRLPIRGAFVADSSIDFALRDVEPPAHNSWDKNWNSRVNHESREIAKGVMSRIRRSVKEFAQEFAPPALEIATDLPLFGKLLGGLLGSRVPGPRTPPDGLGTARQTKPQIMAIGRDRFTELTANQIQLERTIQVDIPSHVATGLFNAEVSITANIAWDIDARASSDSVEVEIIPPKGFRLNSPSTCMGELVPGKPAQFIVKTSPYDRNLTIVLSPRVELRASEKSRDGN